MTRRIFLCTSVRAPAKATNTAERERENTGKDPKRELVVGTAVGAGERKIGITTAAGMIRPFDFNSLHTCVVNQTRNT